MGVDIERLIWAEILREENGAALLIPTPLLAGNSYETCHGRAMGTRIPFSGPSDPVMSGNRGS